MGTELELNLNAGVLKDVHEDKIKDSIKDLAEDEMINAIANHGYFGNAHEASSVLREEIEEVSEALAEVEREFKSIWANVRSDRSIGIIAKHLEAEALNLVYESLQVLAVLKKIEFLNEKSDSDGN